MEVELRRKDGNPARKARMELRYESLELLPPRNGKHAKDLRPVEVRVILVREKAPPPGVEEVEWMLLTTLPVRSVEEAAECVRYYCTRWLVERYHYVVKSGCHVEELELEERVRLERALATYAIVAWRLLWLTYEARQNPERSCETVLERAEWQVAYHVVHKGKNLPEAVPGLREAVRLIARLGGFLGRRHDGEPGVKTLWRGLQRLHDMMIGHHALRT
jgi:hypothetical protein